MIAFAKIALGLNPSTCGVEQAQLHSDQLASFAVADDLDRQTAAGLSDDGSDRDAQGVLHAVGRAAQQQYRVVPVSRMLGELEGLLLLLGAPLVARGLQVRARADGLLPRR